MEARLAREQRSSNRRDVDMAGRLTWKDARGMTRFTSVVARNISDHGVFVECASSVAIPLYRLVHLQLERDARERADTPLALRQDKVLSAVYRIGSYRPATGTPEGYALRLLVEPHRHELEAAPVSDRSIA